MTVLRICFVGDSITLGTADPEFQGWVGRLCAREVSRGHDISAYNLGIRADTSQMIAGRWRAECEARLPDTSPRALVFAFGVNDGADEAGRGLRVEKNQSIAIARKIMAEACRWLPTLWIGPTPVDENKMPLSPAPDVCYDFNNARMLDLNDAYRQQADALNIPYLDMASPLTNNSGWPAMLGDGVHPAAPGYDLLAAMVENWPAWRHLLD